MNLDSMYYPYASKRFATFAKNGMVSTSQNLAAQAGLSILQKGGNAIDAAIATAACLTVVEPTSNGIGGDNFALVWVGGKLHGMNSSGFAPGLASIEALKERGITEMPSEGFLSVTVPGAPAGWVALAKKFGRLPLTETLAPAIRYAEEGFPVSPIVAKYWRNEINYYRGKDWGEVLEPFFDTFTNKEGKAPVAGEYWRCPAQGATLRLIAETEGEAFYRGELAEKIDAFSRKHNAFIRKEDLAAFATEWVDPISVNYRGYDVWEIPPNGQGLVALMALNTLNGMDIDPKDTPAAYHKQIEALKLAFSDGKAHISDPRFMRADVKDLLSEEFAAQRRAEFNPEEAILPQPGTLPSGGTVYLAAADGEGNMISMIQSNYRKFGSGIVVPGTGISLQNRGAGFTLDESHPNALAPGKKPYHTIIPGFLTKDGEAVGPFGVMGGFMQPQGHLQVVMNTIDWHLNPQAALDAPRWMWTEGKTVRVEPEFPKHIAEALARMGHDIVPSVDENGFGRGQIIWRDPKTGVLMGGTDRRCDSQIAAY